MSERRFRKIENKIYDKRKCTECYGTGKIKKLNGHIAGCARCLVRSGTVILSDLDLKWLLKKARK